MDKLIDKAGQIDFGLINESVSQINYQDYDLRSISGKTRPLWLKKLLFKQFYFVGFNTPDLCAGLAVVDLKYVANAFFYVYRRQEKTFHETTVITLPWPCLTARSYTCG